MLRGPPVTYNQRRIRELPIPVIPATNQAEAQLQSSQEHRAGRRHSVPSSALQRPSAPNNTVETSNSNHSSVLQVASQQVGENLSANNLVTLPTSDNSAHMPSNTFESMSMNATDEILITTSTSNADTEVTAERQSTRHTRSQTPEEGNVVESHFGTDNSTSPLVALDSILAISTEMANAVSVNVANASPQTFEENESIVSDSQMIDLVIDPENFTESNAVLASHVAQEDQFVFAENLQIENDPLNFPGCSYWTDSEAMRQSQLNDFHFGQFENETNERTLNTSLHEADDMAMDVLCEPKPEMAPLHEISTENSAEISSMLQLDSEAVIFEDTAVFPKPMSMAFSENDIMKRENDTVSGDIGFNEAVSILKYIRKLKTKRMSIQKAHNNNDNWFPFSEKWTGLRNWWCPPQNSVRSHSQVQRVEFISAGSK